MRPRPSAWITRSREASNEHWPLRAANGKRHARGIPDQPNPIALRVRVVWDGGGEQWIDVSGRVIERLKESGFLDEFRSDSEKSELGSDIHALERRKAETKDALKNLPDHDIDPAMLIKSLASFDKRIAELREKIAQSATEKMRRGWPGSPIRTGTRRRSTYGPRPQRCSSESSSCRVRSADLASMKMLSEWRDGFEVEDGQPN